MTYFINWLEYFVQNISMSTGKLNNESTSFSMFQQNLNIIVTFIRNDELQDCYLDCIHFS